MAISPFHSGNFQVVRSACSTPLKVTTHTIYRLRENQFQHIWYFFIHRLWTAHAQRYTQNRV
ncbi:hypothetical protein, partial [Vreelandella aquamarina]|uniref:hypothetical protein n=1 Tax=Vreelandella aquamarina TaxID=77097 RepID=UPI001C3FAD27